MYLNTNANIALQVFTAVILLMNFLCTWLTDLTCT